MKKETIIKRLTDAKIITKKGKINAFYYDSCRFLFHAKESSHFHLKSWYNKGAALKDTNHWRMIDLLKALKLNYSVGNDAPRGGVEGDFIYVHKKELRKLQPIDELL